MDQRTENTAPSPKSPEEMRIWERLVEALHEAGQDRTPTQAEFREWLETSHTHESKQADQGGEVKSAKKKRNQEARTYKDSDSDKTQQKKAAARKAFVNPILRERGLSILDWAAKAKVTYNTPAFYLKGTRKLTEDSRKKLADALGVAPKELPD
jgi:hypothetical protein